jgi:hypothetical protein
MFLSIHWSKGKSFISFVLLLILFNRKIDRALRAGSEARADKLIDIMKQHGYDVGQSIVLHVS